MAREDQPAGGPERRRQRRYPRRPVLGDPVPVLEVHARVADAEDLVGPERRLPYPEADRDHDRCQQRADRHADPAAVAVAVSTIIRLRSISRRGRLPDQRPLHRQPPHPEVAQRHRERHEDDQHRHRQQPSGQQHSGARHEQRDGQQRGRHREDPEEPPWQPPPPLGQPLAFLRRAQVKPPNGEESAGDGGRDGNRRSRLLLYVIPNGPVRQARQRQLPRSPCGTRRCRRPQTRPLRTSCPPGLARRAVVDARTPL